MSALQALAQVRGLARAGRVYFARHAVGRMAERGASRRDVEHALRDARSCAWQEGKQTWKVSGEDLSGDALVVAVVIDDGLLVVTVF